MKLNALGVTSSNLMKTVEFYRILGFQFPEFKSDDQHLEPINTQGIRLMIDGEKLITEILGAKPRPANHSHFAIEYDTPVEVDSIITQINDADFDIVKQPWDAFWGQRYAIVKDPDGYMIDLYAQLPSPIQN